MFEQHLVNILRDRLFVEQGEIVQIGTYAELLSSCTIFPRLLKHIDQCHNEQQSSSLIKQISRGDSTSLAKEEEEEEEEVEVVPTNIESKQEGNVKWKVYVSYLQASVNAILGLILIITFFVIQQATDLCGNRWLAQWSNDEGYRHRHDMNCTNITDPRINRIRSMSESEWNKYRNERLYTYAGEHFPEGIDLV